MLALAQVEVDAANLIVLPNAPVTAEFSKQYFAHLAAEHPGFNGTLGLSALDYTKLQQTSLQN
jgi:hypothetical protein